MLRLKAELKAKYPAGYAGDRKTAYAGGKLAGGACEKSECQTAGDGGINPAQNGRIEEFRQDKAEFEEIEKLRTSDLRAAFMKARADGKSRNRNAGNETRRHDGAPRILK
ncbi:MAG: hypothetical protein V8T87_03925 [Victivallales bacterium]